MIDFENINIRLHRVKPYSHYGRTQTPSEAKDIDEQIKSMLKVYDIDHSVVRGDEDAATIIYNMIFHNYSIRFIG